MSIHLEDIVKRIPDGDAVQSLADRVFEKINEIRKARIEQLFAEAGVTEEQFLTLKEKLAAVGIELKLCMSQEKMDELFGNIKFKLVDADEKDGDSPDNLDNAP